MLDAIFLGIYGLDFHEILALLFVFTVLFYVSKVRFGDRWFWKPAVTIVLMVWAAAVVAQTILRRSPGAALGVILQPFQSYVDALKEGGEKELLRSNFMNAVLFYPAGLLMTSLLPEKWKSGAKVFAVVILFALLGIVIEFSQYRFDLGLAQTDDVIHNVLGAMTGAVVILTVPRVFEQK